MQSKIRRYKDLGELQSLLLKACPGGASGKKSIPVLAKALEISHQYLYRWIDTGRVPPKYVRPIVELSGGAVTVEDFHPYVF